MWRIEAVGPEQYDEGLAMVVGAGEIGPELADRVSALRTYLNGPMPLGHCVWWACAPHGPVAASLAILSPGRTGVVLHSTAESVFVDSDALSALLAAQADDVLGGDATLVQALLPATSRADIAAFEAAGFGLLAELLYMRQTLRGRTANALAEGVALRFECYNSGNYNEFASTVQASYADSLDCPALSGLRDIQDVLAGHKAAGIFREDLWTIAYCDGRPAGVVLLNQNLTQNVADLIYMGVAKPFRGRGVGRILLARAAELAISHRFGAVALAVDATNTYARRLYERAGFIQTHSRMAYMRTARR